MGNESRLKATTIIIATTLCLFLLLYFAWTGYRSVVFYRAIKITGKGWEKSIIEFDPTLGFAPKPGAQSVEFFPEDLHIDVRFDESGFRVPVDYTDRQPASSPLILTLGGSYTFGTACAARETFPFRLAATLGGTTRNAALGSYGITQEVILARRLIPKLKPDIVVVQYSPWLVFRAVSPHRFMSAYHSIAFPFIFERDEFFDISPTTYTSAYFRVPVGEYVRGPSTILNFASFHARVGVPLSLSSDFSSVAFRYRELTGQIPIPASPSEAMVVWAYDEIRRICEASGAKMVIVLLDHGGEDLEYRELHHIDNLKKLEGVLIADAHKALWNRLANKSSPNFIREYCIWRGEPPRLIDRHPSPHAHALIAEAIVEVLRSPVH